MARRVKGLVRTMGLLIMGIAMAASGAAAAAGPGADLGAPGADGTPGMCPDDVFPYCRALYYGCLVLVDVADVQAAGPVCALI